MNSIIRTLHFFREEALTNLHRLVKEANKSCETERGTPGSCSMQAELKGVFRLS
jgi:hypothetical protein